MNTQSSIEAHYESEDTLSRIESQLRAQGIDPDHPTLESLARFDNFHSRGLAATFDLIALADFPANPRVLDVGGGIGGAARRLASQTGASVTVLDLTPGFVEVGRKLTERVGLSSQIEFELGDGTHIPYPAASFDGVWTQHSTMNIQNKSALYSEIHRVLKPTGRLAMHEVIGGNGETVDYPMPWASSSSFSFLLPTEELRTLIIESGFCQLAWEDETQKTLDDLETSQRNTPGQQPRGQMLIFGPAFIERIQNFGHNLRLGKLAVVQALFERVSFPLIVSWSR